MPQAYEVFATDRFAKDLQRLDPVVRGQALRVMEVMGLDPDGEPLRGDLKGLRSRRVRRGWRIVFQVEGQRITLLGVGTHYVYGSMRGRWRR